MPSDALAQPELVNFHAEYTTAGTEDTERTICIEVTVLGGKNAERAVSRRGAEDKTDSTACVEPCASANFVCA
jgi:hypothetical protein